MKQYIGLRLYLCICAAILTVLLLFSCSAKNESEDKALRSPSVMERARQDSIGIDAGAVSPGLGLEADSLDREQLEAFMQRAEQKLKDLSDYIAIITDKNYNQEFRNEAYRQVQELLGDTAVVPATLPGDHHIYKLIGENPGKKLVVQFSDINVLVFPERMGEKLYLGRLSFTVTTNTGGSYQNEAAVIIGKFPKQFGNELREVWEVKLGEFSIAAGL